MADDQWGAAGWDHARQLERELAEAKFDLQFRRDLYALQSKELAEARNYEAWKARDEYKQQRDTLAEALEEITNVAERVDGWESFPSSPIDRAHEAIAAVKGGQHDPT